MSESIKPLKNCGKCGLCLTTCPVYNILKEEQASPRARLQLIKSFEKDTLKTTPLFKELISKCLMCGSCKVTCPSGINHYEKFKDMREKLLEDLGESAPIKSLIFLLAKEYRIRMGAGMTKLGQKITPDFLARNYKLGNIPLKQFPKLNKTPFRRQIAGTPPTKEKKGRLLYFTGCATNYLYEDTGTAVVGVLNHLGYEVILPKGQTCCGIPLMFHGARNQAVQNMETNLNTLAEYECDGIIVDCSTCGTAIKEEYPNLIDKMISESKTQSEQAHWSRLAEDARKLAASTMDILTFIADHQADLTFDPTITSLGRVAYHAPCHSRNSFKNHQSVQDLLKALPFLDYTATADEADCCGGGGTFFYEYPELSKKMLDKKIESVRSVNAEHWTTDCPVCRMNLNGNLNETEKIRVENPVSLIYKALKTP